MEIYSRNLEVLTPMFPEIVDAALDEISADSVMYIRCFISSGEDFEKSSESVSIISSLELVDSSFS